MTRRAGNQPGNPESDVNAAKRERTALEMRLQGKEFAEIAAACGYLSNGKPNASAAYKAYKRALARLPGSLQHAEDLRQDIALRYNLARGGMWEPFTAGKRSAVEAMVLMDRHEAELYGAYPAGATTVTGPLILELPSEIAAMVRGEAVKQQQIAAPQETDDDGHPVQG